MRSWPCMCNRSETSPKARLPKMVQCGRAGKGVTRSGDRTTSASLDRHQPNYRGSLRGGIGRRESFITSSGAKGGRESHCEISSLPLNPAQCIQAPRWAFPAGLDEWAGRIFVRHSGSAELELNWMTCGFLFWLEVVNSLLCFEWYEWIKKTLVDLLNNQALQLANTTKNHLFVQGNWAKAPIQSFQSGKYEERRQFNLS